MKIYKILLILCLPIIGFSQLVNQGGTITIQNGAKLIVESDVSNTSNGVIDIQGNGELQVENNLTLATGTTFTNSTSSKVIFNGTGNSELTSNGAVIENVVVNKTSDHVILMDNLKVATNIDFLNDGKITLGVNDLVLESDVTITNAGTAKYVQADGDGRLIWEYAATGSKKFEIGDVDDYSPLTVDVTSATMGSDPTVAVGVEDIKHPQVDAGVTDFLTRTWSQLATDMTDYEATIDAVYTDGDVSGDETNIKGGSYDGAWSSLNATGETGNNNTVSVDVTSTDSDITGLALAQNLVVELKVLLQGPNSGGVMSDALRSATPTLIPTTEPYTGLGYVHSGTGGGEIIATTVLDDKGTNDNIVDWVVVELRNSTDNTDILTSKSALLQRDGDIVDLDGVSPLEIVDPGGAGGTYFIAVRHRNHLGFMSLNALALSTTSTAYDFTDGTIPTYGTNALKIDGGTYMMWAGDVTGDGNIFSAASPSDVTSLNNGVLSNSNNPFPGAPGSIPGTLTFTGHTGYLSADINMDGSVLSAATPSDVTLINNSILSHPNNPFPGAPASIPGTLTFTGLTQQLP